MHGLPSRSGAELMDRLREAAVGAGAELVCDAQATALFVHRDGNVAGLIVRRPDGSEEHLACRSLVLACGGYGGDKMLVSRHVPEMAGALYFGHAGNQGDALRWGEALGAATRDLAGYQGHGSVAHPHGILITWATITEGGVQVNAEGRRFSDETRGYSEQATVVLAQPGGIAWTVFDDRIAGIARQFEDFRQAEAAGAVLSAQNPSELARQAGLPAEALAATLDAVDRMKRSGLTDGFGRCFAGVPELQAPLHAVRVTGALFHTQGGLVVDRSARVLRARWTTAAEPFRGRRRRLRRLGPDRCRLSFRQRPPDRDHPRPPFRRRGGTPRRRPSSRLGVALLELPDVGKAHKLVQLRHRIGRHRRTHRSSRAP